MITTSGVNKIRLFKGRLRTIIFGVDTFAGRVFDLVLLLMIILSVTAVILDSVISIHNKYAHLLDVLTWSFTLFFTIEYILRVYASTNRMRYILSFYGLIDLLSIAPVYLDYFFKFGEMSLVLRILRVFRIFRILKLIPYLGEMQSLSSAMFKSSRKILVFFFSISLIILILGTLMYVIEGEQHGFTSIPESLYWAIVTVTTVGYGDITPQTILGKTIASLAMLIGYSIIAIPTGIVTAEISREIKREYMAISCPICQKNKHDKKANFCDMCGSKIEKVGVIE